ncbi:MAG: FecR family protein [bacterium]
MTNAAANSETKTEASHSVPNEVGKVMWVRGQAYVQDASGKQQAIQQGMVIFARSRIITSARAQVGLRMVDGATKQIQANSEFLIDIYDYHAEQPEKSKVKMKLIEGKARSRTGKAGEAAKHNYRLNTPVAAIGIRGTEFTVETSATWTKVVVHSGAIVMSRFDSLCSQAGLGPCSGRGAMALLAEQRQQALLLREGEQRPELIPAETQIPVVPPTNVPKTLPDTSAVTPVDTAPKAHSTQGSVTQGGAQTSTTPPPTANQNSTTQVAPTTTTSVASNNHTTAPTATTAATTVTQPSTQVLARAAPAPQTGSVDPTDPTGESQTAHVLADKPTVEWGRWEPDNIQTKLADGYELVVQHGDYAIIRREDEEITLPNEGVYHFKPTRSEAFVRHIPTETYQKAAVNDANLTVDFIERQFDTQFTLENDDINAVVAAQGQLSDDGILRSDGSHEHTYITGALASGGDSASYAFTHEIDENNSAAGAIDWGTPTIEQMSLQP